jgi:hypothetical protein
MVAFVARPAHPSGRGQPGVGPVPQAAEQGEDTLPATVIFCAVITLVASAGGAAEIGAGPPATVRVELGAGTGKVVSDLHFAADVEFYRPGLAAGVGAEREDFARALRDSGIRALRFPGGNAAYWYLPESPTASLSLCPAHARSDHFVTLSQLAGFAREAGIRLIYELPCLFYLDGESPRAIVGSTYPTMRHLFTGFGRFRRTTRRAFGTLSARAPIRME